MIVDVQRIDFSGIESIQTQYPISYFQNINPLRVATNEKALDGFTRVVELNPDGTFLRTQNIEDLNMGILQRAHYVQDAAAQGFTIKVERMETFNYVISKACFELAEFFEDNVDCHLFAGFADRGSFDWHFDTGNVLTYMVEGTKLMETETGSHTLNPGDWLYIPQGIKHKATNITNTTMLSFGTYEHWTAYGSILG